MALPTLTRTSTPGRNARELTWKRRMASILARGGVLRYADLTTCHASDSASAKATADRAVDERCLRREYEQEQRGDDSDDQDEPAGDHEQSETSILGKHERMNP